MSATWAAVNVKVYVVKFVEGAEMVQAAMGVPDCKRTT